MIFSNPTSSTVFPEISIASFKATARGRCVISVAYFSRTASTKLCSESAFLVIATNEAAVGEELKPSSTSVY